MKVTDLIWGSFSFMSLWIEGSATHTNHMKRMNKIVIFLLAHDIYILFDLTQDMEKIV